MLNCNIKMNLITKSIFSFAKVGFIGLGNMGMPMATNLAKNGHQVYGFDIDASKKQTARNNDITWANDLKQLISFADTFILMVPTSSNSKSICEDKNGIFQNAPKNSFILDCSTISPLTAIQLSKEAKSKGMSYVQAPCTGAIMAAKAGTLNFLIGAETPALFDKSKAILQSMGKNCFNCQKPGAGQIAKLCNNMALAIEMIGVSEALAMGTKLGIDRKILSDIMKVSSSRCWSIDTYNPVPGILENAPSSRNYENGFYSDLMLKDIKLAIQAAQSVNSKVQFGKNAKRMYEKVVQKGMGKKDFSVIYDLIAKDQI